MGKSFWITCIALYFWYEETKYFGWNTYPSCHAELFADALVLCLFVVAICVSDSKQSKLEITVNN